MTSPKRQTPAAGERAGVLSATEQQHTTYVNALRTESKSAISWQARYAMLGHSLYQTKTANDATAFLATRWGMVRELANLDEVAKFFSLIGGKL